MSPFAPFYRAIRYAVSGVLDVLFPPLCLACAQRPPEDGMPVCSTCLDALPRTEQAVLRGNITEELFLRSPHFDHAAAFLFYDKGDIVQRLIHAIKFRNHPEAALWLGQEAAADMLHSYFFDGIDIIAPVPLHPRRLRQRGYNQSEYIARGIHNITAIPLDTTHLLRVRDTAQQALLTGQARQANTIDAFRITHPEDWYRKHILLVDDVVTTGSTLRACLQALSSVRGCRVSILTLAKART
ncbi:MAG: ComF family protein [Paludibacteraceae bacterium]|nr:ComF family protein [Paludibacteraceae bacterium]